MVTSTSLENNSFKKVLAYARVSTKKQEDEGNSLSSQVDSIKSYCAEKDLKFCEENVLTETRSASSKDNFYNSSTSLIASLSTRPKLQEILNMVDKNKVSDVVFYSHDRVSRNYLLSLQIFQFLKRKNVTYHFAKPAEQMTTADNTMSKIMDILLSSFAEIERDMLAARVKPGMKKAIENNQIPGGRVPFGYIPKTEIDPKSNRPYTTYKKSK